VTTYLGFNVLDAGVHNMREEIAESFGRLGTSLASPVGARTFDDQAGIPLPVRTFTWTAFSRVNCNAVRTFLDACQGRLNPFWVPTCCWDLPLAADVGAGASEMIVQRIGYRESIAGLPCRSYIAVFTRGQPMAIRKITGAAADTSITEKIAISATPGVPWPAASTVVSYLVLCRLADDITTIKWFSPNACEASIQFQEVPLEVPA
jgi:hypothetical protein